jgi:hypothetical protein
MVLDATGGVFTGNRPGTETNGELALAAAEQAFAQRTKYCEETTVSYLTLPFSGGSFAESALSNPHAASFERPDLLFT